MPRDWLMETAWSRLASPRISRSPPNVLMATMECSPLWGSLEAFFEPFEPLLRSAAGPLQLPVCLVDGGMVPSAEVIADLGEGPSHQLPREVEAGLARLGRLP